MTKQKHIDHATYRQYFRFKLQVCMSHLIALFSKSKVCLFGFASALLDVVSSVFFIRFKILSFYPSKLASPDETFKAE
ncbi:MAG: hypothetical protein IT215_01000 [Chitinophagaceae bacterium]|nr:MAG: hypothetical protein UZ11_BCD004000959 [Bacteroidetes bacterium OLB11]MCC6447249.1 hypothetical protein [Chitinophagaceae bacterium]HMN32270.1 hypothetical protein [Chitinophagaceae bacterium]